MMPGEGVAARIEVLPRLQGSISRFVVWGPDNTLSATESSSMLFSLLYFLVRRLIGAGGRL